jgi:CRP-like cAMP-binding protein
VLKMGDTSESLFVLVEGEVSVMKGDEPVARLLAGQHFGEIALLEHRPRTATVIARTEIRGLELRRAAFEALMVKDASVGAKILYKLAQSLSQRLDDSSMHRRRRRPAATIEMGTLSSPFKRASRRRPPGSRDR